MPAQGRASSASPEAPDASTEAPIDVDEQQDVEMGPQARREFFRATSCMRTIPGTTALFHDVENKAPNHGGTRSQAPGNAGSTCGRRHR